MVGRLLGVFGCLLIMQLCVGQDSKLHATLEDYHLAQPGRNGLGERLDWLQFTFDPSSTFSFVNTYLLTPSRDFLDESYVRYVSGSTQVRTGRIRSGFGFSDWSDYYYNAIIAMPLIRASRTNSYLGLTRFDTGADVRFISGSFEYQLGLVDVANGTWALLPREPRFGVARVQTYFGPFIVGGSVLAKVIGSPSNSDARAYGMDMRWTADRIQLRGEWIRIQTDDGWSGGYYVDAFYRPPKSYRTQIGVRLQGDDTTEGVVSRQYTVGLRQVITPNFAASVNYGLGDGAAPRSSRGWSFEISTSFHF
jgi:hypothetical protein